MDMIPDDGIQANIVTNNESGLTDILCGRIVTVATALLLIG